MSDNGLCKLCRDNLSVNVDLKLLLDESTISKLLKTLFECYNIDVSILEKSSSICKKCNEGVSQICESLEKWSKAQEVLNAMPLDIDDSKAFQVNLKPEPAFSEIKIEPVQTNDVLFIKEEEPESDCLEFLDAKPPLRASNVILMKGEEPEADDVEFLDDSGPPLSESQEESLQTSDVILIKREEPETDVIEFLDDSGPPLSESQEEPLDTDDAIFIENEEAKTDDEDLVEEISSEDSDDGMPTKAPDWRASLQNFFCVCLGPDGLALTVLFKEKSMEKNIRMLCTCCNQLFATMSDIRKHSSITRPNPEYWCGVCDVIYPSSFELHIHEKLRRHFRARTSAMTMRCLKCGMMSRQLSDAIKHENDVHDKLFCVNHKSSNSFNSLDTVEKYQWKHMHSNVCLKCNLSFDSRDSFEEHQWKHNNHIQCRYPKCKEKFSSWEQYTSHLTWHKRPFNFKKIYKDVPYFINTPMSKKKT